MQILVTVRNRRSERNGSSRKAQNFVIDLEPSNSVQDVTQELSKKVDVPSSCIKLILCGKVLEGKISISNLLLGPQT